MSRAEPPGPPWTAPEEAAEALRSGTGRGVRVAVLDSGVEHEHPRLAECRFGDSVAIVEKSGRLAVAEGEGGDIYGHGTAVAGVIHGVAPEAEIGSFRVLDAQISSRTEIIAEGVRVAMERGYDILNCSFGCRGTARFVLPFKEWVDEAYLKGIHVVAACSNRNVFTAEWPSHFTSVIAVGVAPEETHVEDLQHRSDTLVEFAARGDQVEVAWLEGGTRVETGSSYAAPRVTGMLARLLSVEPGLHPDHAHELLRRVASGEAGAK